MYLYTFIFKSPYMTAFKQIASRLDAQVVQKTYFNNLWKCVTVYKLDDIESRKIKENCYLWEYEIENPSYNG